MFRKISTNVKRDVGQVKCMYFCIENDGLLENVILFGIK